MTDAAVKFACVQMTAGPEVQPNLDAAAALIREAAAGGAKFIATPENTSIIEPNRELALAKSFTQDEHPGLPFFAKLAKEFGVWLLIGSMPIRVEPERLANRSFLIDDQGRLIAQYDKIHLFDVDLPNGEVYRESERIRPGSQAVLAPTPFGPLGMTVCYDLRFPQLYRDLAHAGAALIGIPAAFTVPTGEAHWHVLLRARAIETGAFVLAPAQSGQHAGGRRTYGHSLIVAPWGEILAEAGEQVGIVTAELDFSKVAAARAMIPSLRHDRDYARPQPVLRVAGE
ncbi:carbon-nitrogen hydrolase family protein [Dongia sp.]|uniref:carbon-nitrogen hydrolase family protein n=1 Tax=Dongia sp. TaxID=1977262 RepID=UPI003753E2FB